MRRAKNKAKHRVFIEGSRKTEHKALSRVHPDEFLLAGLTSGKFVSGYPGMSENMTNRRVRREYFDPIFAHERDPVGESETDSVEFKPVSWLDSLDTGQYAWIDQVLARATIEQLPTFDDVMRALDKEVQLPAGGLFPVSIPSGDRFTSKRTTKQMELAPSQKTGAMPDMGIRKQLPEWAYLSQNGQQDESQFGIYPIHVPERNLPDGIWLDYVLSYIWSRVLDVR